MPDPLQFAMIGCGVIAPTHADALAALLSENVRLAACCDIVPAKAHAFAEKYAVRAAGFTEILNDPEIHAVSICAPSGLHGELGVQALRAGKHVIVEKPMDISLAACDLLLAAQQETGKTLAVISQHRFDAASRSVKHLLETGQLGKIVLAEARVAWYRTQEYYDSGDWRGTWAMDGGGCLMNQGVHTVDLVRWLCGPAAAVYAQARTAAHQRIETEDALAAALSFANGAIGAITATTAAYPGFPVRLAIHGTRGSAVIEGDALQTLAIQGQEIVTYGTPLEHALHIASAGTSGASLQKEAHSAGSDPATVWGEAHRAQFADFIRCCRTGERPAVDGQEGRNAVELVLALYESARTGEAVRLTSAAP